MKKENYKKLVKYFAIWDILISFPFAIPYLAELYINIIEKAHYSLNLSGTFSVFEPIHYLFINLMGTLILVWGALRIFNTNEKLGIYDGYARLLVVLHIILYVFIFNVSSIILIFLLSELILGLIQVIYYYKIKK